jgi:ketosteroid isomerase-like protein
MTPPRIALLVIAMACSPEAVTRPPPPPVNWASLEARPPADAAVASVTQQERAIAALYLKALSTSDNAALGGLFADEVHFTMAGRETTAVYGRAAVTTAHEQLFTGVQPRAFAATRVLLTDRSQSIEWTLTGKDRATGKPIGIRGATLITTSDDGTLSDLHLYFDQALLQAQVSGQPAVLAALPLATAPSSPPLVVEQANSADERSAVTAVTRWFDDLDQNENAYANTATDDIEITTQQSAAPATGKRALRAYFEMMHRTISGLDSQLDNAVGIGPFVIVTYHIVGTQRAKYLYVPVKDPVIKLYLLDVIELHNGKIARLWRYEDPIQIVQQ